MAIKSYSDFVNENLIGQYSYYGAGSLFPIVSKLAEEGKSAKQIYTYLTTLGIDEERKRKVISQIFLMESEEFITEEEINEDEIDDLAKADYEDLAKGVDPSKAKADPEVKAALDKLKSGDDEEEKDDKSKKEVEDKSAKVAALQAALKDAEKLDKIKKILSETFEMSFEEEMDAEFLGEIFGYHSVLEKLSTEERSKLKDTDFVFTDTRSWPIHDEKHAKTALVWATWPQYKDKKSAIVKAVIKKYPHLKGVGAAK